MGESDTFMTSFGQNKALDAPPYSAKTNFDAVNDWSP
jgi:hypothetical protein